MKFINERKIANLNPTVIFRAGVTAVLCHRTGTPHTEEHRNPLRVETFEF
jgi:hypothetical protein